VSDTHLLPHAAWYGDDAPSDLLAAVRAFPTHRVLVLGDFIESLVLSSAQVRSLASSRRLAPLFTELERRRATILLGNHDIRAADALRDIFGADRVLSHGVSDGGIHFLHGHEGDIDISALAQILGPPAVPALVTMKRLGLDVSLGAENDAIAATLRTGRRFCVFGHTHHPALTPTYANTGSFLRSASQTLLLLEPPIATLLERLS
jgi:UDP-2,3-diacylglucosamine pyrophosphatase LpxH